MLTVIKREMNLGFRNTWTYSFLFLFTIFTMAILLLHARVATVEGYTDMTGTVMNMTLYLLPLITLLLGSFSTTNEKEDGHWGLLSTYPISTYTFLIGKWMGLAIILVTIILFSFGLAGSLITLFGETVHLSTFLFLVMFALLLALTYLSIAILIGALAKNRWQALILAIGIWFLTIIIWPLLIISTLSYLPSYKMIQPTLQVLMLLNPAEFIRIFSLMKMGAGSAFGADYDAWITLATSSRGTFIFIGFFILWNALALLLSGWIWNRGDKYAPN